jgi:hypothetical protein
MRTSTSIIFSIILFSLILFISFNFMPVMAAYNTTDIDVNISTLSQITLIPSYLNWTQMTAGSVGGYKNITIKNTGTTDVSNVFGWVDTLEDETARPYGSSNPASYAAGGMLTVMNDTGEKYYYLGRLEWNWTDDIPNHDWSAVTTPVSWGYFRNITDNYVWVLGSGTAGRCNESDAEFEIETEKDLGTQATRTPDITVDLVTSAGDSRRWSYGTIDSGTLSGSCVAAYHDCSKIYIYKFDKRTNFTGCGNTEYLNAQLPPGNETNLKIDVWIPTGIPSGNLTRATLTVEAT